jgi:hypothetical protein
MAISLLDRRTFVAGAGAAASCAAAGACGAASTSDAYVAGVLAKHPVAFWRLADSSGPAAADASGNDREGRYHGAPVFGERGPVGTGVRLDGRHDYVEITADTNFDQPASGRGLTVEAWMRPDVLTFSGQTSESYVHWLGKGETGQMEWGFRFYSLSSPSRPNRISAYIWNAPGGEGAGAYFEDQLTAGRWIHVVAVYDAGDRADPNAGVSIYRDGVLRGSPAKSRGARYASYDIVPASGSAPVRLGSRDLESFFTGALAEVAIYPRALGPADIAENFRAGRLKA